MKTYDILVIGGGSVGVPVALYLAKKGKKVAVVEKHASVGRGQNRAAIGGIRATHSDPAKIKICQMSLDIIRKMEHEQGLHIDWHQGGYMFPVYDTERERALKNLLEVQHKFGLNIDWIDAEAVQRLCPGINPRGLRGGTYSPEDGFASPLKTAGAFYKLACDAGVDFYFYETVLSFEKKDSKIVSVKTDKNTFSAGLVINASGGDARKIGQLVGADLPVYPDSHEGGITEPVQRFFEPMIVDIRSDGHSDNYYFYQAVGGQVIFCITPNPKHYGKDCDNTSEFLPLCVRRMLELYPRLRNIRVRRTWRGLYPMTPDGFPIVGYTKDTDNMLHLVGMCGQGYMLGPGLGKIIAETICDNSKDYKFIFDQLSPYRAFTGTEMLK